MSAFICSDEHFVELAASMAGETSHFPYAFPGQFAEGDTDAQRCTRIANILKNENVRSVQYRYNHREADDLPGAASDQLVVTQQDINMREVTDPVHILGMCRCLDYQSCENEDWDGTLAFKVLHQIRCEAITKLPGMENAPWDYSRPRQSPALSSVRA